MYQSKGGVTTNKSPFYRTDDHCIMVLFSFSPTFLSDQGNKYISLFVFSVLGVSSTNFDSGKGLKEEMREKINTIKALLDKVSSLADICGGRYR